MRKKAKFISKRKQDLEDLSMDSDQPNDVDEEQIKSQDDFGKTNPDVKPDETPTSDGDSPSEKSEELTAGSSGLPPVPQSQNPLQCRYCGKVFTRSFYRKEHERIHTGEKPFSCGVCAKKFNSQGSCRKHERTHTRVKSRTHECEHCGKNFKDMTTLRSHLRSHVRTKPYSCQICGRKFTFETVLKKHMMFHNDPKQVQCMLCSKVFQSPQELRLHVRSHNTERPFKCHFCNQSFVSGRRRSLHEKCHESDSHHCKQCGMIFRSFNSLHVHQMKSQLAGGCNFINTSDFVNTMSADTNPISDITEHLEGNSNINQEFDIEYLGRTLHEDNPFTTLSHSSSNENKPFVFPTGLIRTTENGIKKEPLSDAEEEIINEPYTMPSIADNYFHREVPDRSCNKSSDITIIPTDEKAIQTAILSNTDQLFCDLEMAGKIHECKHCRIIFREYSMYLVHKTLHINPVKPFVCHLCGNVAENRVDFNAHLIWHMK